MAKPINTSNPIHVFAAMFAAAALLGVAMSLMGCAERDANGRVVAPNRAMLAASDGAYAYSSAVRPQQRQPTTCFTQRVGTQYYTRCQ